MDKEVLKVVLKKLYRESKIASIIDLEAVPAIPKGENYTSTILRITLKVVLGSGMLAKKSFIMKRVITEGGRGEFVKRNNIAKLESQIYSVILKEMNYLMEEFEDYEGTLWCKFIHYDPHSSCIVLEDLKTSGYSVVPRGYGGLDLDHAILALRGLGRYHAMAKVLEERRIFSKDDFKFDDFFKDVNLVRNFSYAGISNASKVLQESWGPEWIAIGKKMMIPFDPFVAKMFSMAKVHTETDFTCLNHGDCWSNNMMFKYDFQERPISVKFVDFQIPRYNTPCLDLTNFFYLGVQPEVRRSNYQLLLKTYHDSLVGSLDKFGFASQKPSLEEITATMKKLEFRGLVLFIAIYPALTCTSGFDFEKILKAGGEGGISQEVLREPGMIEKLGPDIIDFVDRHLHDLN